MHINTMLPPVGGGSGVTAVTRHGSGEVNRGAGDEGRRESFRFHAIILQCGLVEIGCPILKMNFFLFFYPNTILKMKEF